MLLSRVSLKLKKAIMAVLIVAMFIATTDSLSYIAMAKGEEPVLEGGPEINAESAVVMDINTGAILYAKNPTIAYQPSSLTKLLTCYVACEHINLTDLINVSQVAAGIDFPTAAEIGYTSGENITVQDAIKGALLCSAEDCTYSLAERTSGTPEGFAALMNQAATDLGLVNSNFMNPLGKYEENHYSCAYDMAIVASAIMKNSFVKATLSNKNAKLNATSNRNSQTITSTHRFMNELDNCEHVYAAKTGGSAYGGNGKWALCTYATHKELDLVCIIMDGPTNDSTYADTKKLFSYVWDSFENVTSTSLLKESAHEAGLMFSELPMFDVLKKNSVYIDSSALTTLPLNYDEALITHTVKFEQINDYRHGENVIGKLSFFYNGRFCGNSNILYYSEKISMSASEFVRLFPSFLKVPETNVMPHVADKVSKAHTKKSFFGKIKAGALSYYTPAKTFAFVLGLILFIIGGLIIFLVFPTKKKLEDTLYSSLYDNVAIDEYEGETGNLRRMRISDDTEMQEINSTSSYSDNRKKRNH